LLEEREKGRLAVTSGREGGFEDHSVFLVDILGREPLWLLLRSLALGSRIFLSFCIYLAFNTQNIVTLSLYFLFLDFCIFNIHQLVQPAEIILILPETMPPRKNTASGEPAVEEYGDTRVEFVAGEVTKLKVVVDELVA